MNETIDRFHRLYYETIAHHCHWRGVPILKCAQDLIVFQEIIHETRPECIVECGVYYGGSTLFLAEMLQDRGGGAVIACDVALGSCYDLVRNHADIHLVEGNSIAPETVAIISSFSRGKRTMVVLDSDHREEHVLEECRLYAPLVSQGCYLVVEDTNINGHPVAIEHGPGPAEAVQRFLKGRSDFEIDMSRQRGLITFNPGGYLRRTHT